MRGSGRPKNVDGSNFENRSCGFRSPILHFICSHQPPPPTRAITKTVTIRRFQTPTDNLPGCRYSPTVPPAEFLTIRTFHPTTAVPTRATTSIMESCHQRCNAGQYQHPYSKSYPQRTTCLRALRGADSRRLVRPESLLRGGQPPTIWARLLTSGASCRRLFGPDSLLRGE